MAGSAQFSTYPVPPDRVFILHATQEMVDALRTIYKIVETADYGTRAELVKSQDGSIEVLKVHREQRLLRQKADPRKQFSQRNG